MSSITPIIPKNVLDPARFKAAIEQALDTQARATKSDFDKVTASWGHKPGFAIKSSSGQREISTSSDIFGYVNFGTSAHIIRPRGRFLRFPGSFSPKTAPGLLASMSGMRGGPEVFAKEVHHPGTKPRGFDKLIAKKSEQELVKAINRAIAKVAH